jgi:ABC-type Mn2+/Zn2+ transport system permease subunit
MSSEAIVLSAVMAVAAGLIGCFAVMRRMAIAADPLSHAALPGIGVALALDINPIFGATVMLLFAALLVWAMEDTSRATTETIIGVVFSAALAVGSMTTSGEELIDSLFGGASGPSWAEMIFGFVAAGGIVLFVVTQKNSLIVALVSPDVARTAGVDVRRLNLLYLLAFALTIALGLRYLGVLLMAALIITPPATAKRLARNLNTMLAMAMVLAVTATLLGTWIASLTDQATGPTIVTVAAAGFLASLLYPQR